MKVLEPNATPLSAWLRERKLLVLLAMPPKADQNWRTLCTLHTAMLPQTTHMISAAVLALARLLYEFCDDLGDYALQARPRPRLYTLD